MMRVALAILLGLAGCTKVWPVNRTPYAMSSAPVPTQDLQVLGPVSVRQCNSVVFVIPIVHDPSLLFDQLVQAGKEAGGTALIAIQFRQVNQLGVPFYVRSCYEASGLSVRPKPKPVLIEAPPPPPTKKKK